MFSLSIYFDKGGLNMIYIDAVHYSIDPYTGFEYISEVKWTESLNSTAINRCSKMKMIDFINENPNITKTKYHRFVGNGYHWVVGEDVRVVANKYLRTDANNIECDNLESLPRY